VDPELSLHNDHWRASAAPIAAALIALGAGSAHALSMGKVQLQSALGQSLVAEIDLADLSEDDAKSLKPTLASPSAFAGMGIEFNPALNGTQITLQRRQSGNWYLKVANSRPLNDPFVDMVVELNWASGRIVRTYTLLLDPKKSQDPAPAASQAAASEAPVVNPSAPSAQEPQAASQTPSSRPATASNALASERKTVRVKSGDTAGKIAYALAPRGVSIDQMLVMMLNTNPSAFRGGNVNRLIAEVELIIPDEASVKKTSPSEARRIVDGQNQEFQSLRRSVASTAAPAPVPKAAPQSKSDFPSATAKPMPPVVAKPIPGDTLKLSKGSVQEKANMEQLAQQRAKTEATERAKELAKNIEELNQLAKVAAKPDLAATPALPATPTSNSAKTADSAIASSPASAPAPGVGPKVTSTLPTAPASNTSDLLGLATQNPMTSGLVVGLLALLAAMGWQRRNQAQQSGSASHAKPEPWATTASTSFEKGGGARVDTTELGTATLNSTLFQDSQLELAQELDPVAEAEVYLAYGKDVPAEEILKEGLQQDPTRVAIHLKLLGIFAKRGDANSFESAAQTVKMLVQGSGADWAQVQEMGRALWPSNPLYAAPAVLTPSSNNELSLDLTTLNPTPAKTRSDTVSSKDQLAATLALAEQFLEIGEKEGARALLEEVIGGDSGQLRERANALLSKAA
jgi:pilus assembly protein FimV